MGELRIAASRDSNVGSADVSVKRAVMARVVEESIVASIECNEEDEEAVQRLSCSRPRTWVRQTTYLFPGVSDSSYPSLIPAVDSVCEVSNSIKLVSRLSRTRGARVTVYFFWESLSGKDDGGWDRLGRTGDDEETW